jgi:hypothetical protein
MAILAAALLSTLSAVSHAWHSTEQRSTQLRKLQRLYLTVWYDTTQIPGWHVPSAHMRAPFSLSQQPPTLQALKPQPSPQTEGLLWIGYATDDALTSFQRLRAPWQAVASLSDLSHVKASDAARKRDWSGTQLLGGWVMDAGMAPQLQWPPAISQGAARMLGLRFDVAGYGEIAIHAPLAALPLEPAVNNAGGGNDVAR